MEIIDKVLMIGEPAPKINIICDLLSEPDKVRFREYADKGLSTVRLQHCDGISSMKRIDNSTVLINSLFVPFGTEVILPFQGIRWSESIYDQIIFIQPYPFTIADNLEEFSRIPHHIREKGRLKIVTYKILFYRDINQHSGSGDMDTIDEALNKASEILDKKIMEERNGKLICELIKRRNKKQHYEYCRPHDLTKVFHGRTCALRSASHISRTAYTKWKYGLASFKTDTGQYKFTFELEDRYKILAEQDYLRYFTGFEKIRGCSNIVKKYTELYCVRNEKVIREFVREVYESMIRPVCFWDLNRDIDSLLKGVQNFVREKLDDGSCIVCPKTEEEYRLNVINETSCDYGFMMAAKNLIEKDLMIYLYDYLQGKDKILSELFGND